jgi:RNA polymerase primary sigma factor
LDYITDYGATIRMPSNKTGLINKLKRHLSIASQKANREVDILDLIISGDKTFTEDELLSVMPYMVNVTSSLDEPIEHHDGTENKHELYEETTFGWADKSISESDTLKSLFKRMDTLRPMERTILNHRYGLNGESEKTLKMCGELEEIGMTAESVRKIEMRALSKLRRGGNLL